MNISQAKHYSLLLQDDGASALFEGVAHEKEGQEESIMDGDFHTIIEEDEQEEEDEDNVEINEREAQPKSEHVAVGVMITGDDSEEELFNGSPQRIVMHEGLKLKGKFAGLF